MIFYKKTFLSSRSYSLWTIQWWVLGIHPVVYKESLWFLLPIQQHFVELLSISFQKLKIKIMKKWRLRRKTYILEIFPLVQIQYDQKHYLLYTCMFPYDLDQRWLASDHLPVDKIDPYLKRFSNRPQCPVQCPNSPGDSNGIGSFIFLLKTEIKKSILVVGNKVGFFPALFLRF